MSRFCCARWIGPACVPLHRECSLPSRFPPNTLAGRPPLDQAPKQPKPKLLLFEPTVRLSLSYAIRLDNFLHSINDDTRTHPEFPVTQGSSDHPAAASPAS